MSLSSFKVSCSKLSNRSLLAIKSGYISRGPTRRHYYTSSANGRSNKRNYACLPTQHSHSWRGQSLFNYHFWTILARSPLKPAALSTAWSLLKPQHESSRATRCCTVGRVHAHKNFFSVPGARPGERIKLLEHLVCQQSPQRIDPNTLLTELTLTDEVWSLRASLGLAKFWNNMIEFQRF